MPPGTTWFRVTPPGRRCSKSVEKDVPKQHSFIDIVIELPGRRVIALEVKATSSPSTPDAKHLFWMRDLLGDRFTAGAVLHTGPDTFQLGDRVLALPIWTFWS